MHCQNCRSQVNSHNSHLACFSAVPCLSTHPFFVLFCFFVFVLFLFLFCFVLFFKSGHVHTNRFHKCQNLIHGLCQICVLDELDGELYPKLVFLFVMFVLSIFPQEKIFSPYTSAGFQPVTKCILAISLNKERMFQLIKPSPFFHWRVQQKQNIII